MKRQNDTLLTVARIFAIISGVLYIFLIVTIPLAVLNFIAASKIKAYQDGDSTVTIDNVRNWSIYLIFTSLIGGICGLIASMQDEGPVTNLEADLAALNELFDKGLITKEEYELRRKAILEKI